MSTAAPRKRAAATKTLAQKNATAPSRGQRVIKFIEKYVIVPEGSLIGKPMVLLPEQKSFITAVYDNLRPDGRLLTRRGIFSIARKNGKTGLIAALLQAHLIGPEAKTNSQLFSAARSRDQAALVFNYAAKSLQMNPQVKDLVAITPSSKVITGLLTNAVYKALSADAATKHGLSPALTIHDELGQVVGPNDALYDALETAGGAQAEPLSLIISTQAANDADLLSTIIDDAIRTPTPESVCHLYAADKRDDIWDPEVWKRTNFALGIFRSVEEFEEAARRAKRMPSFEATFRNLYLNMRISLLSLFIAPSVWEDNNTEVNNDLFTSGLPVHVGIDLSQRTDLSAAVLAVQNPDDGVVHIRPYVYSPIIGLEERAKTDRVPYHVFAEKGQLIPVGGRIVEYDQVAEHLELECRGMNIVSVNYDRWRIELFRKECEKKGFAQDTVEWVPVGQGFKDMSPRLEIFEALLLNRKLAHGRQPLMEHAVACAIAMQDPARNRKLEKSKSTGRIDPLVAAVMAVYACIAPPEGEEDTEVSLSDFVV